ncbi:MAG: tetratricopeptide repeat protein, partial [Planctomycetota bacterium]
AGEYETALTIFRDILAENPTIAVGFIGIGDVYMQTGDYDLAEPAFRRAARLEPGSYDAQLGHGQCLHRLGRLRDAIDAYARALSIDPGSFDANLSVATAYLALEQPTSALSFAEAAVAADAQSGPAHANLGSIYVLLDRHGAAVDEYLAAMELMPLSPPLLMNLINALAEERRHQEVINAVRVLLRLEESANAFERLGYAYFRLAQYDRSLEAYRNAIDLDPDHWQSLNGIGVNSINRWLVSDKQDTEAAVTARTAFRRSLQVYPNQPRVLELMSNYQL